MATTEQETVSNAQHLRGTVVASKATVAIEMDKILPRGDDGVYWGGLNIPTADAVRHFCVMGTVGSGKTILIRLLMQSVLRRIPSISGEFVYQKQYIDKFILKKNFDHPIVKAAEQKLLNYYNQEVLDAKNHLELRKKEKDELWAIYTSLLEAKKENSPECKQASIENFTATRNYSHAENNLVFAEELQKRANGVENKFWGKAKVLLHKIDMELIDSTIRSQNDRIDEFNNLRKSDNFNALIKKCCDILGENAVKYINEDILEGIKNSNVKIEIDGSIISLNSNRDIYKNISYRSLVYDAKQDSVSIIRAINPHCRIVILNPFDKRCAAWDMAKDIIKPSTALQVATILIPENESASQPFFSNAARQLVAGVLQAFILLKPGQWDFRDVINATKSKARLATLLSKTPYTKDLPEQYLNNEGTAGSILSEIATHMGAYEHIAAAWSKASEKVSLTDWVSGNYILILGNDAAHRAAIDSVNKLIFQRLTELILAKPETKNDQTWIFLDEIREAGKLEGLSRLLNMGRSKGACVVLGFQDIEGMQSVYGEKEANEIVGQCNHMSLLRLNSPKTAQWASDRVGSSETIDEDISFQKGRTTQISSAIQDGKNSTNQTGKSKGDTRIPDFIFSPVTSKSIQDTTSYSTGLSSSTTKTEGYGDTKTDGRTQKKVIKPAILPSEFLNFPITNHINGLSGIFMVPQIIGGTYFGNIPGIELFPRNMKDSVLIEPDESFPNFVHRPIEDEYLQPWTNNELVDLGIIVEPTKPKDNPVPKADEEKTARLKALINRKTR